MENKLGKAFLKTLLYSTSAMALSIGAANAGVSLNEHEIGDNNPLMIMGTDDTKKVEFDLSNCVLCGGLSPIKLEDGSDIGFRIDFSSSLATVATDSSGLPFGTPDAIPSTNSGSLSFSVMAGPGFKIIGAILSADAGVMSSYTYEAMGEESGSGTATASATGDIDLGLTALEDGTFGISFDDVFDVNSITHPDSTASGLDTEMMETFSADTTGSETDMDDLAPLTMYNFTLAWDLTTATTCSETFSSITSPAICVADSRAELNSIDIRFKQMRMDIPEPASLALFGLGLAGLGALQRRRRKISA